MVLKRCFYFDRNGNPLRQGCPRKASCRFVHPNDPEWDKALVSIPPPHIGQRRSPPLEIRKFETPVSPMEHDKSTSRHRSRRSRSPRRQRSRDRSEGEVWRHDEFSEGPRRQSSDHQRKPETSLRGDKAPPATPHTGNAVSSNIGIAPSLIPPNTPQPPPRVEPPPQPSASIVLTFPPPPPIPSAPFWQTKLPSARPEPTPEEARIIWLERIKFLTDCLRHEKQLKKLQKDVDDANRNLNRQRVATLPDVNQKEMKAHLSSLETLRDEMEKVVESGILRLVKSKSWPMAPQPINEGQVDKSQEMINYLNGLTDKATEMYKVLIDIRERNAPPPTGPTAEMDVDPQGSSSRPPKRRRLSESELSKQAPSQPSAQEMEALCDRVLKIEERFSVFENDLNVHDVELAEAIEERVEAKLEETRHKRTAALTDSQNEHREFQENINKTGADMDEIASEITELIKRTTAQEVDRVTIQREIETLNTGFKGLQEKLQQFETNREKHRSTIEALEAAVTAHVAQPLSPPGSPCLPTHDHILEELEDPIVDMVRTHTKPLIETVRSQVEELLRIQNKEMYDIFSSKLALTLQTMEVISGRIETPERTYVTGP